MEEKGSGSDVHVEDDRPDKREGAPTNESGDEASAGQAREETAKDAPQTEGRIKIAAQTDGETSGSLLASSSQSEKPDRLVKLGVSYPVSAP